MIASSKTPPAPLRVLVVDDEKNIRTTLALALEGMGCALGLAATAESAAAQAARDGIHLCGDKMAMTLDEQDDGGHGVVVHPARQDGQHAIGGAWAAAAVRA